ncbi:hypothetical protein [Aliarcobacter butzleri]|nr:hypothetical protein [Aliarcobacter butzleri]
MNYFAVKQLLEQRNLEDLKSKGTVLCFEQLNKDHYSLIKAKEEN